MRTLMILRHAHAVPADGKIRDKDRPLSPHGEDEARKIGAYMAHHGLLPERALVSTAKRTQQSFDLLTSAAGAPVPAVYEERLYDAAAQTVIEVIQETEAACATLLVVGHNPGVHRAAVALVAAGDLDARARLQEGLPTGALLTIEFPFDDWSKLHAQAGRLTHFVTPDTLKAATE